MNTLTPAIKQTPDFQQAWRLAAITLVAIRFVQGWIYWGGGSRRFFYAPSKLDPNATHWMAYKFQTAMPGALFGLDHVISWLLHHFYWLYASVIFFSAVELIVGVMLITGTLTRLAAFSSIGLSFVLMLMFGWQGATCIDEWTMAACNFGMGVTLFLAGSGAWSVDSWLARTRPQLTQSLWFQWFGGVAPLPLSEAAFKKVSAIFLAVTVVFVVSTYSYYRGSVYTAFHGGPVSPTTHHWALRDGQMTPAGQVSFTAYVDAGTPEAPSNVVRATLSDSTGKLVQTWDTQLLTQLPKQALHNDYDYLKIHTGPFGIVGPTSARATISLPPVQTALQLAAGGYTLQLISVNGRSWKLPLTLN
jgi:uncharacterized membrane protein YphA (DoxX/SURF4 family)